MNLDVGRNVWGRHIFIGEMMPSGGEILRLVKMGSHLAFLFIHVAMLFVHVAMLFIHIALFLIHVAMLFV